MTLIVAVEPEGSENQALYWICRHEWSTTQSNGQA